MGRHRKPSDVREMEGNPSKRAIPEEVELEVGSFDPPEILDKIGRKYWRKYARLLHKLGRWTEFNEIVMENLCMAVSSRNKAFREIALNNQSMLAVVDTLDGGQKLVESEPAKLLRHWVQVVQRIAKDCCMTPDGSAGIYRPKKDEDALEDLLD